MVGKLAEKFIECVNRDFDIASLYASLTVVVIVSIIYPINGFWLGCLRGASISLAVQFFMHILFRKEKK